jgi:hypothetical protein
LGRYERWLQWACAKAMQACEELEQACWAQGALGGVPGLLQRCTDAAHLGAQAFADGITYADVGARAGALNGYWHEDAADFTLVVRGKLLDLALSTAQEIVAEQAHGITVAALRKARLLFSDVDELLAGFARLKEDTAEEICKLVESAQLSPSVIRRIRTREAEILTLGLESFISPLLFSQIESNVDAVSMVLLPDEEVEHQDIIPSSFSASLIKRIKASNVEEKSNSPVLNRKRKSELQSSTPSLNKSSRKSISNTSNTIESSSRSDSRKVSRRASSRR